MIYYCDDLPHPTREHEAFIEKGVERLLEILSISNGKALVLFTAKTDMEEVYSILSEKNLPYKILMQQPGSSQDKESALKEKAFPMSSFSGFRSLSPIQLSSISVPSQRMP